MMKSSPQLGGAVAPSEAVGGGPVRTCVGCRRRCRDVDLLRVAVADQVLVPDPRRRLPGRGAWIHPDEGCVALAEQRRAFDRSFRGPGRFDVKPIRRYLSDLGAGTKDRRALAVADGSVVEGQGNEVDPS